MSSGKAGTSAGTKGMGTRWGGDGSTRVRPWLAYSTLKIMRGTHEVDIKFLHLVHDTQSSHVRRASPWMGSTYILT